MSHQVSVHRCPRVGTALWLPLALWACGPDTDDPPAADAAVDESAHDASEDLGTDADSPQVDTNDGDESPADRLTIPGLTGPVDVAIDAHGIPHISCGTDPDCAAVLGYMHSRDRFAQMDIRRRVTTGRLHELVGALALDVDTSNRNLYATPQGRPAEEALLEGLTAETRALLEGYARGVNAWLADEAGGRNGAALQDEYGFALVHADEIPPWTPADSLSTVLALINYLTNDSGRELALGIAYAALTPEQAADLFGPTPATVSIIEPGFAFPKRAEPSATAQAIAGLDRLRNARPALEAALDRVRAANVLGELGDDGARGSNNWVLAPAMTADGVGLLSNDPHLGLSNPSVWYVAHVDALTHGSGSYRAAGQTFAGMPWIVIGHNDHIAWGATTTTLDQSDVYLETLSEDGGGVIFNGEVVPFVTTEHAFAPFDGPAETRTLRFVPHHGPVLSIDAAAGTAVSLAWTGNSATTDGNFLTELMRAATVAEARTACENVTTIGQSWVVADTAGSIGWFPYNHVPSRPWASMAVPSFLPVPGDGSAEWGEWLPYAALPQLYNPSSGYIATANNDMTGALTDGDPFNDGQTPLQVYADSGYRHARIVERIEAGAGAHDASSMEALVGDTLSALGRDLAPALRDRIPEDPAPPDARVRAALDAWDFGCPSGIDGIEPDAPPSPDAAERASAVGCAVFHVLLGRLLDATFADELAAAGLDRTPDIDVLVRLVLRPESLEHGRAWWDDVATAGQVETEAEILAAAVVETGTFLEDQLGADPARWLWGRLHTVTLRADLFDDFGVETYNNGPWVNDGGTSTVDVAAPRSLVGHDYTHDAGPSTRFVCRTPATGVRCTIQLPGGQRHFRDSANYQDGLMRWLRNQPVPLEFDIDAALAGAATVMRFE